LIRTPDDGYLLARGDVLVTNYHKDRSGILQTVEKLVTGPLGSKSDVVRLGFNLDLGSESVEGVKESERRVGGKIVLEGMHNPNDIGHGPEGYYILAS
jgi:hypothetical protein